jgi:hypothetical protein
MFSRIGKQIVVNVGNYSQFVFLLECCQSCDCIREWLPIFDGLNQTLEFCFCRFKIKFFTELYHVRSIDHNIPAGRVFEIGDCWQILLANPPLPEVG